MFRQASPLESNSRALATGTVSEPAGLAMAGGGHGNANRKGRCVAPLLSEPASTEEPRLRRR